AARRRHGELGYRPDCCVFMLEATRRLSGETCDGSGCSVLGLRREGWATKTSFGNSSAHIRTKEVSAFHGRIRAKLTLVFLARVRPLDAPLLLRGAEGPRALPTRGRSGRGRPLPPRPQPPRVRLPDRLRAAVPPLPGPAAPGSLRRAAGLHRHAAEPGPG